MISTSNFKEHQDMIWGTICPCGNEVSILQNVHHPWDHDGFVIKTTCPNCFDTLVIDSEKATHFYNNKIYSYFNTLNGVVLDLGCGGGFLSERIVKNIHVEKVIGVDIEAISYPQLAGYNFEFVSDDLANLSQLFEKNELNYLVSRDVFMYIENTEKYFDDVTQLVSEGIFQMGWYISNHPRTKNNLTPDEIVNEYKKRGFETEIEYLDWYKSGYFIKAVKHS